jgi:hypothetical protein
MAVEDGVVLAELAKTGEPLVDLLPRFMERRYERCRVVVKNSRLLGEWEMHPGALDVDPRRVSAEVGRALAQPV